MSSNRLTRVIMTIIMVAIFRLSMVIPAWTGQAGYAAFAAVCAPAKSVPGKFPRACSCRRPDLAFLGKNHDNSLIFANLHE